jgi:hypothetical protein
MLTAVSMSVFVSEFVLVLSYKSTKQQREISTDPPLLALALMLVSTAVGGGPTTL